VNSADTDAASNRVGPGAAWGLVRTVFPSKFGLCRIAGIFADAFSDYPLLRWALTDQSSPARTYFQLFRLLVDEFGSKFGAIDLAEHDSGAAVWIRSDRLPQPNEEKCRQIKNGLEQMLGAQNTKKLLSINHFMERHHPGMPHLYLYLIGVRIHRQRRGLGSQLMLAGLKTADIDRIPVFTETSSEDVVQFYRHFNFEIVDKYFVARRSPATWTLLRTPPKPAGLL
jgi:ribosomal protein S18 acetylase RimI-like enzyme